MGSLHNKYCFLSMTSKIQPVSTNVGKCWRQRNPFQSFNSCNSMHIKRWHHLPPEASCRHIVTHLQPGAPLLMVWRKRKLFPNQIALPVYPLAWLVHLSTVKRKNLSDDGTMHCQIPWHNVNANKNPFPSALLHRKHWCQHIPENSVQNEIKKSYIVTCSLYGFIIFWFCIFSIYKWLYI